MGFFGFTTQPPKDGKPVPAQPRHRGVVDIDEAHEAVRDVLEVWRATSSWGEAPPFSGGVWDAWPQRVSQGLAFLRNEMKAVVAYLQEQSKPKEASRG